MKVNSLVVKGVVALGSVPHMLERYALILFFGNLF